MNKDILEGRGAVNLDVSASGRTVTALEKGLAGSAAIALKEGALKGVDFAAILRVAQGLLGSKSAPARQAESGAKTDFSELTATFVIKNGVAHNEDLKMTSPLVRVTGRGDINLPEATLDYTAKATVTEAAAGLGGKDLAQLAGVAVPVQLTGPLANPRYTIVLDSLAEDLAKGAIQREIERRMGSGSKPGGKPGSDPVGDVLRGLFGKPK